MSVGEPMVVVEYHDCGHHRRGHHEHDAVEIRAYFFGDGREEQRRHISGTHLRRES